MIKINRMQYLILVMFAFWGLVLNAQENLPDRQFYYYKGERFYLDIDYSRISVISEGKFNVENIREAVSLSNFKVINEGKNYTRQAVVPLYETSKRTQNKEIFITEIEFSGVLEQTDYHEIIQQFSKGNNVIKVLPTHTVSGQRGEFQIIFM